MCKSKVERGLLFAFHAIMAQKSGVVVVVMAYSWKDLWTRGVAATVERRFQSRLPGMLRIFRYADHTIGSLKT